jgi:gluconate 2-dehydrogenase
MKPKIILYSPIAEDLVERLERKARVYKVPNEDPIFLKEIQTAEGVIGSGLKVDKRLLSLAPNLSIVSNISAGYDNLDIKELNKKGIMVTNTPDVLTETTADTIFGLLMATARRIPELDAYVKSRKWTRKISEDQFGVDINHKTLGIIGMGRIGKAVAERAHYGFKMNIIYHNRSRNLLTEKELKAQYMELGHLLETADYICLTAPLSKETVHLIGRREFEKMKKTAIFINGARGAMVVEEDLVQVLKSREIRAAGLDVYKEEPLPLNSPLLKLNNLVTTPHIGSATNETRYKMAELAVENMLKGLNKEEPPSLINKEIYKRT